MDPRDPRRDPSAPRPVADPASRGARRPHPRGWTVLRRRVDRLDRRPRRGHRWTARLPLVEAMSLADLVTAELGATPEPDRAARRPPAPPPSPHRTTVPTPTRGTRRSPHCGAPSASWSTRSPPGSPSNGPSGCSRSGTAARPREAFDELRRRARSQGRPAQELAAEVLDGLAARAALHAQRARTGSGAAADARPAPVGRRHLLGPARAAQPAAGGRRRRRRARGPALTAPLPLSPAALADRLAELLAGVPPEPGAAALRVALDGPDLPGAPGTTGPRALADALAERLPSLSRPTVVVPAEGFYRPASLRLEHGRTDPDARYTDWLDAAALAREVLDRCGPRGPGSTCPRCGTSSGTGRPGWATGLRRPAGRAGAGRRCCRASAWRSTSSSTCG